MVAESCIESTDLPSVGGGRWPARRFKKPPSGTGLTGQMSNMRLSATVLPLHTARKKDLRACMMAAEPSSDSA